MEETQRKKRRQTRRAARLKAASSRFYNATAAAGGRGRWLKLGFRIVSTALVASVILTVSTFAYLYWQYSKVVDERLASGYLTSRAGIYAAPRVLRAGQKLAPEQLENLLRRAGYVDAEAGRVWSGRFRRAGATVEIEPNETSAHAAAQGLGSVRVEFGRDGRITSVYGDGQTLDAYTLEPEPLTDDTAMKTAEREALAFEEIPPVLVRAVLSTEDRRFFEHGGVDLWGVARAALSWGDASDEVKQGGSTITQQLVKNTYLTPERTLRRKFREAALASVIESRLSKEQILALYCNEIYLGQRGSIGVRGVRQAARVYFGKDLKDISLAEAATLAGMIQSPGRYAPDRRPEQSRARRNIVLAAMLRDGAITHEEARRAAQSPVEVAKHEGREAVAPHFVDYVMRAVESKTSDERSGGHGLRVHTTLDLELQQVAEEAVRRQTERLGKSFKGERRPQAALVALDPHTGQVLAMVGGTSYAESQLNRATDARRQPGSVFKPVVFAAALEAGISPLSLSMDAPREFRYDRRARYRPANYGNGYAMREVTLRTALVRSLNVVTVDTALRTGLTRVASLAEKLGLPRPEPYPSLSLGTTEATPLEVATAYTAFAGGGRLVRPTPLLHVDGSPQGSAGGNPYLPVADQVLRPATSAMLTDMLTEVVESGTARAAKGAVRNVALAGKTGTARDGWFAGYTPNLVCVVWVGFDDGEELGMTGADSALPIWIEFVRRATELRPELGGDYFARPDSVRAFEIDPETGALAGPACAHRERVVLSSSLAPTYECLVHRETFPEFAYADGGYADHSSSVYTASAPPLNDLKESAAPRDYDRVVNVPALPQGPGAMPRTQKPVGRVVVVNPSAARATAVELGRDGRTRLTNDVDLVTRGERWER